MSEGGLVLWTIYRSPADFPNVPYVLRSWVVGPGGSLADAGALGFADTLWEARSYLPEGLTHVPRSPGDEPQIVETWL